MGEITAGQHADKNDPGTTDDKETKVRRIAWSDMLE